MKKIIALALALIMALSMGSVAFAASGDCAKADDNGLACEVEVDDTTAGHLLPGEKYILLVDDNKDVKVTAKWDKGGALVAGIAYEKKCDATKDYNKAELLTTGLTDFETKAADDSKGAWVLTLKENFTITDAKDLVGTITISGKDDTDPTDKLEKTEDVDFQVANHKVTIQGEEDLEDVETYEAANNTLYVCEEDWDGYVKFNGGALLSATLNMVGEEKAFMYNDESAIEALTEKYPDAEIECYNFGGEPTFKNAATFTLQADYADQYYVYTYENGKLVAQDYEWDSIEGVYKWETKSPVSYVLSDVELVAAAEDEAATKNPDTGANDVVGVAAALAVVSLVAAGAVSLKK